MLTADHFLTSCWPFSWRACMQSLPVAESTRESQQLYMTIYGGNHEVLNLWVAHVEWPPRGPFVTHIAPRFRLSPSADFNSLLLASYSPPTFLLPGRVVPLRPRLLRPGTPGVRLSPFTLPRPPLGLTHVVPLTILNGNQLHLLLSWPIPTVRPFLHVVDSHSRRTCGSFTPVESVQHKRCVQYSKCS